MEDIEVKYFKKLYIGISEVCGQGLFASEPISKGDLILRFGGILVPLEGRYSGKYLKSTFVGIAENVVLCEAINSKKDLSDYINHSCDPNAGMYDSITIMAIKDIMKDEEIYCDYAFWEGDEDWVLNVSCSCGSILCRHTITGLDWKNVRSSDEKFSYFSPFIKRRILEYEQGL